MKEENPTPAKVNVEELLKRVAALEKELEDCQSALAKERLERAKEEEEHQAGLKYWMDKHYESKKYLAIIQNTLDIARAHSH